MPIAPDAEPQCNGVDAISRDGNLLGNVPNEAFHLDAIAFIDSRLACANSQFSVSKFPVSKRAQSTEVVDYKMERCGKPPIARDRFSRIPSIFPS
jgi:hypothetical protein